MSSESTKNVQLVDVGYLVVKDLHDAIEWARAFAHTVLFLRQCSTCVQEFTDCIDDEERPDTFYFARCFNVRTIDDAVDKLSSDIIRFNSDSFLVDISFSASSFFASSSPGATKHLSVSHSPKTVFSPLSSWLSNSLSLSSSTNANTSSFDENNVWERWRAKFCLPSSLHDQKDNTSSLISKDDFLLRVTRLASLHKTNVPLSPKQVIGMESGRKTLFPFLIKVERGQTMANDGKKLLSSSPLRKQSRPVDIRKPTNLVGGVFWDIVKNAPF